MSVIWLALAVAPASAFNWAITNISPNPVKAGCDITISGSFWQNQGVHKVRFGKGSQMGDLLSVKSWSPSTIVTHLPENLPAGTGWIAIYGSGGGLLVKSAQNVQVLAGPCSGSSGGSKIRPAVGLNSGIQPPPKMKAGPSIKFAVTPKIRQVRSNDGFEIKRGGEVRIEGESFGTTKGKVHMRIPGYLDTPRELYNVGWISESELLGGIPSDLPADMPVHGKAQFRVQSASGRVSAWFKPRYRISSSKAIEFATRPKIRQVTGPNGIGPGKDIVIDGSSFGSQTGWVTMHMGNDTRDYVVANVVWESPRRVRATVPMPTGLSDANLKELSFRVTTHDGKKTGWYKTSFDPTVEILLPFSSGAVFAAKCGTSDRMICNSWKNGINLTAPWKLTGQAVRGYHSTDWDEIGNDTGSDEYRIKLGNGWVISNVQKSFTKSSGDESISASPANAAGAFAGKSEAILQVNWSVSPADYLMYEYKIWIKGPQGKKYHCGNLPVC